MVRLMTELLLTVLLTCQEANSIVTRAILNDTLSNHVVEAVIDEVRLVSPPHCVLPEVN